MNARTSSKIMMAIMPHGVTWGILLHIRSLTYISAMATILSIGWYIYTDKN